MADSMQRILIPTDFSDNAAVALHWATELARHHGASVTILHVADTVALGSLSVDLQDKIEAALGDLTQRVGKTGVDVSGVQQSGCAWERIIAETADHDLLVIGARGQTPKAPHPLGIGSTFDRGIRGAVKPVLTVHDEDRVPEGLPRTAILPTDFSPCAERVLESLDALCRPTADAPLEVTLLHAWQPLVEYEWAFAGTVPPNPIDGSEDQAREQLQAAADRMSRAPELLVRPSLDVGHPAAVIEDRARALGPDIVAIGTHGRSGISRLMMGSVTEHVMHHVQRPVLTLSAHG